MTIQGLIDRLQDCIKHGSNPNAIVRCFDPESEQDEEITGFTINHIEVIFYTNIDDEVEPVETTEESPK